jgi:hypothetical protein
MRIFSVIKTTFAVFTSRPLWQRRVVFGFLGAIGGYAYYYFIGCARGTCTISSNPYISTAYGTLIGLFVPAQKKTSADLSEIKSR